MRIRLAMPVHAFVLALLTPAGIIAQAQTPFTKLLRPATLHPILQPGILAQNAATQERLHIEVLKGDGGVNILGTDTAAQPVIEVRDRNNQPVANVAVTFTAPSDGPSAIFLNGSRSITLMTDSSGQATLLGIKPVSEGQFQVAVSASVQAETVVTAISLTNEAPAPAAVPSRAKKQGLSKGVIFALVGAGAAAAIGIGVGLGGHGSSSGSGGASGSSTSSASIGLGNGGVTASPPH